MEVANVFCRFMVKWKKFGQIYAKSKKVAKNFRFEPRWLLAKLLRFSKIWGSAGKKSELLVKKECSVDGGGICPRAFTISLGGVFGSNEMFVMLGTLTSFNT